MFRILKDCRFRAEALQNYTKSFISPSHTRDISLSVPIPIYKIKKKISFEMGFFFFLNLSQFYLLGSCCHINSTSNFKS